MEFANYFDITIAAIVIILALKGLFSGFIRELFSVIGIIGGVIVASRFNVAFGEWVNSFLKMESQTILALIGFMLILGAIWILSLVLAEVVARFVKFIKLGKLDRIFGVLMAGIKAFLIVSIILFTFSKINFLTNFTGKLQDSSFCYPLMIKIGGLIVKTDFVSEARGGAIDFGKEVLEEVQSSLP